LFIGHLVLKPLLLSLRLNQQVHIQVSAALPQPPHRVLPQCQPERHHRHRHSNDRR
jgi:hypothetical protein